jgi:hypothetical protein
LGLLPDLGKQLHYAAFFGRPNVVEELLNRGAKVDDASEIGQQTPLHMASFRGNVKVMNKLIRRGANPNAVGKGFGPVVTAAIYSGNREAVRLLVENGVSLTYDDEDDESVSPLSLAVLMSDLSMFEYLAEAYADKLQPKDYDKALVMAARAGRLEVFNRLLQYEHPHERLQEALEQATVEENWDIIAILLENSQGLQCDGVFLAAAIGFEQQDKVLEAVWRQTRGRMAQEVLDASLYHATDREKESTVRLLLEKFSANANATGEE